MTDLHAAPAASPPCQVELDRLGRLLGAFGAVAFERVGGGDALFGPANLWAPLGFAAGEWPETSTALIELLHPDDREQAAPKVAQAVDADVLLGRLRQGDLSYRRVRQRTRVTRTTDGAIRVACCLIDVEDIEREREAARLEQRQLRDDAERRRAEALRLVARASHEIRTPLNGVLGLVDMARGSAGTDAQQRHLAMAAQSGLALTRVLNDVLDLAGLDGPQLSLRAEWADLDELLSEALRSITPQMGWADFAVVYDFDGDLLSVRTDPGRLRQILINLLGNAARMTQRGHVGLSARVRLVDAGRCALTLLIEDTGPGIPPDKLPTLFEPFAMASIAKLHGGTGLGLSIVKTLVAAMAGTIGVDSTVGAGTRIELRFLLEAEAVPESRAATPPPAGHAWLVYGAPAEVAGEWLGRRVARLGWTFETLPSVAAAIGRARDSRPDVLVLAAHALQSTQDISDVVAALPGTRQVLISRADWQRPDIEQRAHDVGMACLLAPVSHRSLESLLGKPHDPRAAASPLELTATAQLRGHVLLVDDDAVNRLIGEHILAAMHLSVASVPSAEAALAACLARPPDAMLMDVQLSGMDGIEASRRIRAAQQSGQMPRFPIIGLTADSTAETADACVAAGMDAVLIKPYRPEALQAELLRRLNTGAA